MVSVAAETVGALAPTLLPASIAQFATPFTGVLVTENFHVQVIIFVGTYRLFVPGGRNIRYILKESEVFWLVSESSPGSGLLAGLS